MMIIIHIVFQEVAYRCVHIPNIACFAFELLGSLAYALNWLTGDYVLTLYVLIC